MSGARRVHLPPGLQKRFDVVEAEVRVVDRIIHIARPRSADALISETDFARDERLPYWADVWPSSLALAEEVLRLQGTGLRLVELGCGLGVVATAAAWAGFDVTITDYYDDALAFAAANVRTNTGVTPAIRLLDWRHLPRSTARFDVVVGADVLYERPYGALVAQVIQALLAPHGVAIVADPGRVGADDFVDAVHANGLEVSRDRRAVEDGGRAHSITLYRVHAPNVK